MNLALRRILQSLLILTLIPFLLDVPAGANASAETLLASGAAPHARVIIIEGRRTVVAEAGAITDPALVLVHGFGGSTFGWRKVMEPLAAKGWHVVALDLPGFGLAEKGWGQTYDHQSQARFILSVMDEMNMDQAVLVGHSMGGNVVAWVAALAPQRVRALVLIDAAIVQPNSTPNSAAGAVLSISPLRRAARILIRSAFTEQTFGELLRSAFAVTSAATRETIRGYAAASQLNDWDLALLGIFRDAGANALPKPIETVVDGSGAPIPTLILWGSADSWVPLPAGESLHLALPNATYVVLPGLGHVPFEEDSTAFTSALQGWLAALD